MLGQRPLLLLLFLATTLWSIFGNAAPTAAGVVYVYRGDTRSPEEIRKAGGFLAKGLRTWGPNGFRRQNQEDVSPTDPDISLFNHVRGEGIQSRDNDGYVSTYTDITVAQRFVARNEALGGYIYKIRVAENMIDCAGTLGRYCNYLESEYAALGGIKFEQVVAWKKYKAGKSLDLIKEVPNPKFDKKKFDKKDVVAGGIQYQLAGFPAGHPAWKEAPWKSHCKRAIGKSPTTIISSLGVGVKSPATSHNVLTLLKKTPAKVQPTVPAVKQPPVKQPPVKQPPVKQPSAKQPPPYPATPCCPEASRRATRSSVLRRGVFQLRCRYGVHGEH